MVVVLDDNVAFLGFDALDVLLGDKRAAAGNAHGREMLRACLVLFQRFQEPGGF